VAVIVTWLMANLPWFDQLDAVYKRVAGLLLCLVIPLAALGAEFGLGLIPAVTLELLWKVAVTAFTAAQMLGLLIVKVKSLLSGLYIAEFVDRYLW